MNRPASQPASPSMHHRPARAAAACALLLAAAAATANPATTGAAQPAAGPAAEPGRIEATVTGVTGAAGLVGCALFASRTGFPLATRQHALLTLRVLAVAGTATCVFEQVPPGEYAVAVVHDTNDNGQADTNLLGMPTEGVGVSNNVVARLSPPPFEACRFTVAAGQTAKLAIAMRY